jgi:hypothetical protein
MVAERNGSEQVSVQGALVRSRNALIALNSSRCIPIGPCGLGPPLAFCRRARTPRLLVEEEDGGTRFAH